MVRDTAVSLRPFGWRGIELKVPENWELNAYDGDASAGHVMLDDGVEIRLQIRWHTLRKRVGELGVTLEQYQRKLARAYKQDLQFEVLGREFLPKRIYKELDALPYSWKGRHAVFGMVARCADCNRALFVEVFFPADQEDRSLARSVLASLTDHRPDDQTLWSIYGFAFKTPRSYPLLQPVLMPGKLQFTFRKPENISWLHPESWIRTKSLSRTDSWFRLERWTTATETLEQLPLERWPTEIVKAARITTRNELILSEHAVRGLRACSFVANVGRSGRIEGMIWRATEARKVFALFGNAVEVDILQQVAESVVCY